MYHTIGWDNYTLSMTGKTDLLMYVCVRTRARACLGTIERVGMRACVRVCVFGLANRDVVRPRRARLISF